MAAPVSSQRSCFLWPSWINRTSPDRPEEGQEEAGGAARKPGRGQTGNTRCWAGGVRQGPWPGTPQREAPQGGDGSPHTRSLLRLPAPGVGLQPAQPTAPAPRPRRAAVPIRCLSHGGCNPPPLLWSWPCANTLGSPGYGPISEMSRLRAAGALPSSRAPGQAPRPTPSQPPQPCPAWYPRLPVGVIPRPTLASFRAPPCSLPCPPPLRRSPIFAHAGDSWHPGWGLCQAARAPGGRGSRFSRDSASGQSAPLDLLGAAPPRGFPQPIPPPSPYWCFRHLPAKSLSRPSSLRGRAHSLVSSGAPRWPRAEGRALPTAPPCRKPPGGLYQRPEAGAKRWPGLLPAAHAPAPAPSRRGRSEAPALLLGGAHK